MVLGHHRKNLTVILHDFLLRGSCSVAFPPEAPYESPDENENKKRGGFVNAWRLSAKSSSENIPNKKEVVEVGKKRQAIYQYKRKQKNSDNEETSKSKLLRIMIKSVGCFDPPYHGNDCDDTVGSININGVELSQNKPGFNFVLVDFRTGEFEQAVSFDTHGKAGEYEKLSEFLNTLEMWKIICVAVKDDAKNYLPLSALKHFARIGAHGITTDEIEYRSSYAFVGLTGPEKARTKMDWIREENSRAGDGPSIISVHIKAGLEPFKAAGGKVMTPEVEQSQRLYGTEQYGEGASKTISNILGIGSDDAKTANLETSDYTSEMMRENVAPEMSTKNSDEEQDQKYTNDKDDEEDESDAKLAEDKSDPKSDIDLYRNKNKNMSPVTNDGINKGKNNQLRDFRPKAGIDDKNLNLDQMVSAIMNRDKFNNDKSLSNMVLSENVKPNIENFPEISKIPKISKFISRDEIKKSDNDFEISKSLGQKETQEGTDSSKIFENASSENVEILQNFLRSVSNTTSDNNNNLTENPLLKLKENETSNIPGSTGDLLLETVKETLNDGGNISPLTKTMSSLGLEKPYSNTGAILHPSNSQDSSLDLLTGETRSDPKQSMMEKAADGAGGRNVGESRLASALSSLGIPDAGATGIASLMSSGFAEAANNNRKDAALKLGLAAKLAKSIADLGGRGAASAAGIASLNELLKDSRDMSISRIADQIGQALQRVGGAGAAVGYAALAAALKATSDTKSPGGLVGGVILALAEQGAAPGTAGLAALAAGLGGSGADALAGGLGGSLPNVGAAIRSASVGPGGGVEQAGVSPVPSDRSQSAHQTFVQTPPAISSNLQYHPGNIETEYTGQGPIGSVSQGNFANAAKLVPNHVENPEPIAALSQSPHPSEHADSHVHEEPVPDIPTTSNQILNKELVDSLLARLTDKLKESAAVGATHETLTSTLQNNPVTPGLTAQELLPPTGHIGQALQSQANPLTQALAQQQVSAAFGNTDNHGGLIHHEENSALSPNINEILTHAIDHKEGISIPEILSQLQHPTKPTEIAANIGTSLVSQMKPGVPIVTEGCQSLPSCVSPTYGGELVTVPMGVHGPLPDYHKCGGLVSSYSKRCLNSCDGKTIHPRLLNLQSTTQKASIKINNEDWSKDENGFNIVVMDFNTGAVEATENFDTSIDGGAARAMSNFISSLKRGKVILGAAKGEAGELMSDGAYSIMGETGAKILLEKHLQKGDKYVFIGYNGDKMPWMKEQLSETAGINAELNEPIIVGPGALKNTCTCLSYCKEKDDESLKAAKTEEAYADMGGEPIAAGTVGTKRMTTTNYRNLNKEKIKTMKKLSSLLLDISNIDDDDESSSGNNDEKKQQSVIVNRYQHKANKQSKDLLLIPISNLKSNLKKIIHGENSLRNNSQDKHIQHNISHLIKPKSTKKKSTKAHKKTHKKSTHSSIKYDNNKSNNIYKTKKIKDGDIVDLIGTAVKQNSDDTVSGLGTSSVKLGLEFEPNKTSENIHDKEQGLSLVNSHIDVELLPQPTSSVTLPNEPLKLKSPDKHSMKDEAVDSHKFNSANTYDDVYSTIGNNLHTKKRSEQPRPGDS